MPLALSFFNPLCLPSHLSSHTLSRGGRSTSYFLFLLEDSHPSQHSWALLYLYSFLFLHSRVRPVEAVTVLQSNPRVPCVSSTPRENEQRATMALVSDRSGTRPVS